MSETVDNGVTPNRHNDLPFGDLGNHYKPVKIPSTTAVVRKKADTSLGLELPRTDREFFVPVHGFIWLSEAEYQIISHPAFQRLGNVLQLGMAHLIYRGATHTRFEHSVGAIHVAQMIITAIDYNNDHNESKNKIEDVEFETVGQTSIFPRALSVVEKVFIRLATLLHDIGHIFAGHTLEDELRLLKPHDEINRLRQVVERIHWFGFPSEPLFILIDTLYLEYMGDGDCSPTDLMMAIVARDYESILEKRPKSQTTSKIKLPSDFRLQVCRDIVGNTICADFLDYVHRDWHHLGKGNHFDHRIFQYMEIRTDNKTDQDAFVISLGNQVRPRTDAITAIVNLLEKRYQLAESVYFHRGRCKAGAMLERAIMEICRASGSTLEERKKWLKILEDELLDHSDWSALLMLAQKAKGTESAARPISALLQRKFYAEGCSIYRKDLTADDDQPRINNLFSIGSDSPEKRNNVLKQLEKDFLLPPGTLAMYCPTKGMNAKIPEVRIHIGAGVASYDEWNGKENSLDHGLIKAELERFTYLWRAQVFIESEEWNKWNKKVRGLFREFVTTNVFGILRAQESAIATTENLAVLLSATEGSPHFGKKILHQKAARRTPTYTYPSGVPPLMALFEM